MGTIQIDGSTPKLTIGNATAEDATILFDGNAQDFYIALDDSADDLLIGLGSTVGTTPAISINEDRDVTISDGAIDFDVASHDGTNGLKLGGTLVTSTAAELNILDGTRSQIVQVQYDIATADGNLAVTGAGFAPETVIVFTTVSNTPKWCFGMGTKADDDYRCTVNNYLNSADNAAPESQIVSVYTGNEPTIAQADIDSWDADGITLSWTKTRSPTGTANMYFMFCK